MQHEQQRVPVTALAFFHDNVILAGEGCLIKAYDIGTQELLADAVVFCSQTIHGVAVYDIRGDTAIVLAWGNRMLCCIKVACDVKGSVTLTPCHILEAGDWILDAAFSRFPSEVDYEAAIVTTRNALSICKVSSDLGRSNLKQLVPGSNCILYSACVTWLSGSCCLVASGTAFGDVLVWSSHVVRDNATAEGEPEVHYIFSAHQGSVFGMAISPPGYAAPMDGRARILATCSDDRTICLWDISGLDHCGSPLISTRRSTGFGSHMTNESSAPPLLAKVMGHVSRIWHVCFIQNTATSDSVLEANSRRHTSVLSFGEDASCITWAIEQNRTLLGLPYCLRQSSSRRVHSGKHIWAVARSEQLQLATGGADGAVHLTSSYKVSQGQDKDEFAGLIPHPNNGDDKVKSYGFLSDKALFMITENGKPLLLTFSGSNQQNFVEVSPAIPSLRGYSTVAAVRDLAFFAGTDGKVYMYHQSTLRLSLIVETQCKVAGLFVQDDPQATFKSPVRALSVLITNVTTLRAHLLHIVIGNTYTIDAHYTCTVTEIELSAGFIVTSFSWWLDSNRMCIVFGSRNGSVACLCALLMERRLSLANANVYFNVHEKEAVTSICLKEDKRDSSHALIMLTTGRDGTYAAHRLARVNDIIKLDTKHQLTLPFGPNIEGLHIKSSGDMFVWGFRSKHFIVYNTISQQEIMAVDCGGVHRSWAYRLAEKESTFIWTKASCLYRETQKTRAPNVINSGAHGREIKAVATSPVGTRIIATGAEDTDIRLGVIRSGHFECLHTLRKHNTGIQHLQWSSTGRYLFSSGGFEEFYVWKLSHDIPILEVGVVCETAHPNCGLSDLRIMNFCLCKKREVENGLEFEVVMVYSDASMKRWRYCNRQWLLQSSIDYMTACLTQCLFIADSLVIASTDGHIGTWAADTGQLDPKHLLRQKIHQSAILSLKTCLLQDGSSLLISGGDDNAIGLTRLSCRGESARVLLLSRAHAAAVTALAVIQARDESIRFVSASTDQRVKLWEVRADCEKTGIEGVTVRLVASVFTAVADISSMDTVQLSGGEYGICICGAGLDLWRVNSDELTADLSS